MAFGAQKRSNPNIHFEIQTSIKNLYRGPLFRDKLNNKCNNAISVQKCPLEQMPEEEIKPIKISKNSFMMAIFLTASL